MFNIVSWCILMESTGMISTIPWVKGLGTRGGARSCTRFLAKREGNNAPYNISMVVGKVVVDCIAGTIVGIMVDNMVEAFELVVVGSFVFVELGYVAICWQYMGGLGKLAGIHHGPPCRSPEQTYWGNCSQTS